MQATAISSLSCHSALGPAARDRGRRSGSAPVWRSAEERRRGRRWSRATGLGRRGGTAAGNRSRCSRRDDCHAEGRHEFRTGIGGAQQSSGCVPAGDGHAVLSGRASEKRMADRAEKPQTALTVQQRAGALVAEAAARFRSSRSGSPQPSARDGGDSAGVLWRSSLVRLTNRLAHAVCGTRSG